MGLQVGSLKTPPTPTVVKESIVVAF